MNGRYYSIRYINKDFLTPKSFIMNIEVSIEGEGTFVCHAHFPEAERRVSHKSEEICTNFDGNLLKWSISVPDEIKRDGGSVCLVLLKKENRSVTSWYPYGRCRILNLGSIKEGAIHSMREEENLASKPSAKAKITMKGFEDTGRAPPLPEKNTKNNSTTILKVNWFLVSKSFDEKIQAMMKKNIEWFKKAEVTTEVDEGETDFIKRTHMPYWNNNINSLPGWFFAIDAPLKKRYKKQIFTEAMCAAKIMLHFTNRELTEKTDLLLGLTTELFGGSVRYGKDIAPFSRKGVERFSSLARNDGIGDCEDISKESCMAFSELKALKNVKLNNPLHGIWSEAQHYIPCVLLVTVKTFGGDRFAHAVCGLLPKSFLYQTGTVDSNKNALLCDGTYLCFPRYDCPLPDKSCKGKGWQRPYEYRHAVSAMLCEPMQTEGGEVREVFFSYAREPNRYGVLLKDLCTANSTEVRATPTHKPFGSELKMEIEQTLKANRPIVGVTTRGEWSITERFTLIQRHRLNRLMGFSLPLIYPTNAQSMLQRTLGNQEFTGFYDSKIQQYVETADGFFAGVPRECFSSKLKDKNILYHNHHLNRNFDGQKFNPPSHHDVLIFIAMRATREIFKEENCLLKLEVVPARDNVFEMLESVYLHDEAFDACAYVVAKLKKMNARHLPWSRESVYHKAHAVISEKLTRCGWLGWLKNKYVDEATKEKGMFINQKICDEYINAYEEIGITIIRHSRNKRDEIVAFCRKV